MFNYLMVGPCVTICHKKSQNNLEIFHCNSSLTSYDVIGFIFQPWDAVWVNALEFYYSVHNTGILVAKGLPKWVAVYFLGNFMLWDYKY